MDELTKLEERIDKLVSLVNELRQKVEDLEESNGRLQNTKQEAKKRVDGLIEKVDNLLI
ncbi:MAG: cell division protein ZapB [candidate division WOR-3 bacterium]|nr:MAG: cell division protein ZapB [candidate division WOR-3 bacterium]